MRECGGGDTHTETTLRRAAAGLSAAQIDYTADQIVKRHGELENVGGYAVAILRQIQGGYSGP